MDKKAKEILFKTYWNSAGWKSIPQTDPLDFEYAKSMGVMFDPLTISKTELISKLESVLKFISLTKITNAFLCSLTNKRLDWRSGIASYANAKRLFEQENISDFQYGFGENEDLNILNFERIKWGGVRHNIGLYNLLDLELLNRENIASPTDKDIETMKYILSIIENSQPGDTPSKLRDNLKNAISATKEERHALMEILGSAGILKPLRFDRKEPGKHDWTFVLHWRGEDKYDHQNAKFYFAKYGIQ